MLFRSLHHVTASPSKRQTSTVLGALPSLLLVLYSPQSTDEKYFDSAGGVFHPMPPRQWFLSVGYRI